MDFGSLNTKIGAEKGAFMQLKHPAFGTLLWDGEGKDRVPVGINVRGTESKTVQDRLKELQQDKMSKKSKIDTERAGMEFACSLVIDWTGIDRDGSPVPATDENIKWFFGLSDSFVEQVLDFAQDRASFFKVDAES